MQLRCCRDDVFAVRVAHLPSVAQAAQEFPVLAIGALPVRLLAQVTPIRCACDTAPTTREQTLERCPNLTLVSVFFFVLGTKSFFKVPTQRSSAGQGSLVSAGITKQD